MAEGFGESPRVRVRGEGRFFSATGAPSEEVIKEKKLTFDEASKCLNTLGKDETGSRYAYLMITATDRKLTDVSIVLKFKHVMFLDLSGNYLTTEALQIVAEMPFLVLLKAERNRADSAALKPMYYLQVLDLNQNQIKTVEDIDQPLLDCLELNYNDIYTANFDSSNLENLQQLELRSNLLFEINGAYPPKLKKLYMAANKIAAINSLEFSKLSHLEVLHLRDNSLQCLDGFSETLSSLKYLNLRNNKIDKFREFKKLECLPKLETLIVLGNPLLDGEVPRPGEDRELPGEDGELPGEDGQRRDPAVIPILVQLPRLKRINKTVITVEIKIEAEDMANNVLETLLRDEDDETERDTTTTNPNSDYRDDSDF